MLQYRAMAEVESILVVEDDDNLRELVRLAGAKRSYRMLVAGNGLEAKSMLEEGNIPDLVVLDITMPGMDGFAFCRWLREDFRLVPVIFLSARAEEYDKIVALEIGGDDYLTKPFSMRELFARIQVSLRRVKLFAGDSPTCRASKAISLDGLKIDPEAWTCEYEGENVYLTISEFRILQRLISNPGLVINRDKLAEAAFPDDRYNLGRSVDVHICRIRQKLLGIDPGFDSIETVYQLGYKWKS
jgi:DNA-binding response OmpR family regulator